MVAEAKQADAVGCDPIISGFESRRLPQNFSQCGLTGKATVSKTVRWGFESLHWRQIIAA